ncbi:MAG: redoxin domain-containing protein [Dehalococcoidia bacterium]|nr:redoxin domain-containing protein [Dehalococcoidia bacterium]
MTGETRTLKVGDPAPDFELKGTGTQFRLSDHRREKNVVLAFFPAFSPVCSQQMPQIERDKIRFDGSNAVVVGISVDNVWSLEAFAEALGINFPLLSDFHPHGAVAQQFGVLRDDGHCERALIAIDKAGVIRYIDVHPILEVPSNEAAIECLREVGGG